MSSKILLDKNQFKLTIKRLAHQLIENETSLSEMVFVGLQPRGVLVSDEIINEINLLHQSEPVQYGKLDITFYRDDIRRELHIANATELNYDLEGKKVVLIDDVLHTGRTIRASLDALQAFGRPAAVELCVLIDRWSHRELPISPNYTGLRVNTFDNEKVKIDPISKEVILYA